MNIDHARSQEVCRFHAEAQAAAQLQHPNIVQVFDVGEVGNLPYFTQEFVEGGTLAQRLAKETLSTDEATRMLHELATAVAFAHSRGIVHRDLKTRERFDHGRWGTQNCRLRTRPTYGRPESPD